MHIFFANEINARLMRIFAKKSENFPNFTEKFRPLVNKTSVQKKNILFSINFYFSETGACLGGRRTYLTRLSSDQLGIVYLTNILFKGTVYKCYIHDLQ